MFNNKKDVYVLYCGFVCYKGKIFLIIYCIVYVFYVMCCNYKCYNDMFDLDDCQFWVSIVQKCKFKDISRLFQ